MIWNLNWSTLWSVFFKVPPWVCKHFWQCSTSAPLSYLFTIMGHWATVLHHGKVLGLCLQVLEPSAVLCVAIGAPPLIPESTCVSKGTRQCSCYHDLWLQGWFRESFCFATTSMVPFHQFLPVLHWEPPLGTSYQHFSLHSVKWLGFSEVRFS